MIRLWESTEKNFKSNKWILNECTKSEITEVVNGEFALDLEYPLQDTKGLSKYIVRGNIITCPVKDDRYEQQFRIRKVNKTSKSVVVYAESKLIADLKANRVRAMTVVGKTRKQAIQYILDNTIEENDFVVGNLDTNTNDDVVINIEEGSALEALIGTKNSILSEYGGEFIISNNSIDIVDSRGSNNGFTIAYGKNISSIKETTDDTDLVTVLIPKSGNYRLPEYVVESPNVSSYEKRYFKEVNINLKIWDGTDKQGKDEITQAEANVLMRDTCNKMFIKDKLDQINFNYSVNLVTLGKTEEYKEYAILESTNLGDTVEIKHKLLNLDLTGRMNKTIYNVLLDKYSKLEIGFAKQDIADIINTTVKSIQLAKQEISLKVENVQKNLNTQIQLTEDTLRLEATNNKTALQTSINQTATEIRQEATNTKNNLQSSITQNANKINAVVQNGDTEGSFELNESAFIIAFKGASDGYSEITADGITIYDGRFRIKKRSNTVFYVNANGRCTADGGFVVEDGDSTCKIDSAGITMTNEDGYTSGIYVKENETTLTTTDDFDVKKTLRARGNFRAYDYAHFNENVDMDKNLDISGTLIINGDTLQEIIDERIDKRIDELK